MFFVFKHLFCIADIAVVVFVVAGGPMKTCAAKVISTIIDGNGDCRDDGGGVIIDESDIMITIIKI